jgi:hypothetical protein
MAMDISGNELHGTLQGQPQWVSGLGNGIALAFDPTDGSNDFVELPDTGPLVDFELKNYSISAWFMPQSVPTGQGSTIEYSIVQRAGFHRGLAYGPERDVRFDNWLENGSRIPTSGGFIPPDGWYHLVGILDVESGRSQLYVDGQLTGENTFPPGSTFQPGDGPWRFGIADPGATMLENAAHGAIDDVRLYDRVLTVEEIQALSFAGP